MERRFWIAVLVLAVLWQSLPVARFGIAQGGLTDIAHVAVHWLGASHHHHADGDFHFDTSTDSAQHLIADQFSPTATLPEEGSPIFSGDVATSPRRAHPGGLPPPYLEGPLRPPRLLV